MSWCSTRRREVPERPQDPSEKVSVLGQTRLLCPAEILSSASAPVSLLLHSLLPRRPLTPLLIQSKQESVAEPENPAVSLLARPEGSVMSLSTRGGEEVNLNYVQDASTLLRSIRECV